MAELGAMLLLEKVVLRAALAQTSSNNGDIQICITSTGGCLQSCVWTGLQAWLGSTLQRCRVASLQYRRVTGLQVVTGTDKQADLQRQPSELQPRCDGMCTWWCLCRLCWCWVWSLHCSCWSSPPCRPSSSRGCTASSVPPLRTPPPPPPAGVTVTPALHLHRNYTLCNIHLAVLHLHLQLCGVRETDWQADAFLGGDWLAGEHLAGAALLALPALLLPGGPTHWPWHLPALLPVRGRVRGLDTDEFKLEINMNGSAVLSFLLS